MKTFNNIYKVLFAFALIIGCSDSNDFDEVQTRQETAFDESLSIEDQIMSIPNNSFTDTELVTAYSDIMKEILLMSKDSDFRSYVYENAQSSSVRGKDYIVSLDKVYKTYRKTNKFGKSAANLESLTSKVQAIDSEASAMVFFPKAETIENNAKTSKGYEVAKNLKQPIAVLRGAYNNDYSAPGYKLGSNGKLVFDRMVTEEDAWENDVYVIGAAEKIGTIEVDMLNASNRASSASPRDGGGSRDQRKDGEAEYGGSIQVTDLNKMEHWTKGGLEFKVVVAGVKGGAATIIKEKEFPTIPRWNLKHKKWHNLNEFYFIWNKSNLGDFNVEKWIEVDGRGKTTEYNMAVTYKPEGSTTSTTSTVKIPAKDRDIDLGQSIVQFSDDRSKQIYEISHLNFRRGKKATNRRGSPR